MTAPFHVPAGGRPELRIDTASDRKGDYVLKVFINNEPKIHHPYAFSLWMAGGGVKGGLTYGATDEIGWSITEKPVHVNDFHATLLKLFGINHLKLTPRFQGLDQRLTGVAGKVIDEWIA